MKRIRSNRGGLYPTGQPKRAGYKDYHYSYICFKCGKKILKQESQMSIPSKNDIMRFHWDCKPGKIFNIDSLNPMWIRGNTKLKGVKK